MPFFIVKKHDGTILGACRPLPQTTTDHPGWHVVRPGLTRGTTVTGFMAAIGLLQGQSWAGGKLDEHPHSAVSLEEMRIAADHNHVITLIAPNEATRT